MQQRNDSFSEPHTETAAGNALPSDNHDEINRLCGLTSTPEQAKPVELTKPIGYDPFDLKTIRKNQSFLIGAAEKLISSYSVRKPKKNVFFRVHSGEDYQVSTYIYVDKDEGGMEKETYFLDSAFSLQIEDADLSTLFHYVTLHLAIERHAEKPFLWAVRHPILGGRDNEFWRTAREAAERAKTWISTRSDRNRINSDYLSNT
jgi:hypothetical protein